MKAKMKKFCDNMSKNGGKFSDPVHGYMNAYDVDYASAQKSMPRLLKNSEIVKKSMGDMLSDSGLGIDNLNKSLKDLTRAKKEVLNSNGEVVEIVDNNARMNAVNTAYKLHGHLQTNTNVNIDNSRDNRQVNIGLGEHILDPENLKSTLEIVHEMKELNASLGLEHSSKQSGEVLEGDHVDE
jgi:Ulp1 family protease